MKAFAIASIVAACILSACTPKDSSPSTAQADYADTYEKLVQNKDSIDNDSTSTNPASLDKTDSIKTKK